MGEPDMTNLINIPADSAIVEANPVRPMRGIPALLAFLIEKDRSYREARKLARMDADRLRDMGMPTNSANADFYRARGNRPADNASIPLSGW
ncbi:hypothetical protein TK43_06270 [Roseovarius sp. JS7-11]|nr:hypothetical protein TK43_06270 [Roseovarius sp. JS7-11]